eukprot:4004950-Amphidinium_carterae.1
METLPKIICLRNTDNFSKASRYAQDKPSLIQWQATWHLCKFEHAHDPTSTSSCDCIRRPASSSNGHVELHQVQRGHNDGLSF